MPSGGESAWVVSAGRERLVVEAERTRRTKGVVMAERWEDVHGQPLIVFSETGPNLRPEREGVRKAVTTRSAGSESPGEPCRRPAVRCRTR